MKFSLPSFNFGKCLTILRRCFLYLLLSIGIAFLCHRLYYDDSPVLDAFRSLFAYSVFVLTLLGLSTWRDFRVFIFLLIPKLFNVNGRTVLIAYISYLTLSGPVWNTKRNIGVMSTTLVCAFEEIGTAASDLIDMMKEPIVYLKNLIETMEQRAKKIFAELADELKKVEDFAQKMVQYFRKATKFLKRLKSLCNDKLGTPFQYCTKKVKEMIEDCEEIHDNLVCAPLVTLYPMCTPLKALEIFCIDLDFSFLDEHFVDYLEKEFGELNAELRTFVDVEVEINGGFNVTSNKTKTYSKIHEEISSSFNSRTDQIFSFLSATKILSIVLSFFLFFSIYRFRYNYLTKLHYQNRYLLRSLREINKTRVSRGDPSLFPLNASEERRFIHVSSWRVTYWEVVQALRGIADVIFPCFYVVCLLFGDYALYYLLLVITRASSDTDVATPPVVTVDIEGQGFVADFIRSIVDTYEPVINGFEIDFGVCAPRPHPPDDGRLVLVLFLCCFCLVQSIVYPFAARAMHLIMESHYEAATQQRMAWLYNEIIRRRKTLQMMVYEKISGNYEKNEDPLPVIEWLRSKFGDVWLCRWCLGVGGDTDKICINCGRPETAIGKEEKREKEEELEKGKTKVGLLLKCPTYGCPAVYCRDCVRQLNGVCILCKKNVNARVNYAELSLEQGVDDRSF